MKKVIFNTSLSEPKIGNSVKHPYWIHCVNRNLYTVITYVDDDAVVTHSELWPDATDIMVIAKSDAYDYSGELKQPEWFSIKPVVPILMGTIVYTG